MSTREGKTGLGGRPRISPDGLAREGQHTFSLPRAAAERMRERAWALGHPSVAAYVRSLVLADLEDGNGEKGSNEKRQGI